MNDPTPLSSDSDRWQKVEALYNRILTIEGDKRVDWLARECADDSIRHEVLSLLESAETADSFLEMPVLSFGLAVIGRESEVLVGQHIDRYEILELLGQGGMGDVYLAQDPRLSRLVAVKVLPASITNNPERIRRFEREAKAASAISHPNVAHIYEMGEAGGRHYIAMEYVKGRTLRDLLREKTLSPDNALEIAIDIANALAAAHRRRIIHRDIKPENIILSENGYLKVLDFGLAKLIEEPDAGSNLESHLLSSMHTGPELFMGTAHYMSPEQVRRKPVDGRTDLWSLGVVMYEMLTFRRPFQAHSFSEVIVAILEKEPEFDIDELRSFSPALRSVLVKALQKEANERYQTAEDLLADLRKLKQGSGLNSSGYIQAENATNHVTPATENSSDGPTATDINSMRRQTVAQRFDTIPNNEDIGRWSFFKLTRRTQLAFVGLVIITALAYFGLNRMRPVALATRPINLRFERLSLSGNISDITLSPDGKYVGAVVIEDGKYAIHISELATASDLRVAPPTAEGYSGISFSPDGTYLYYIEDRTYTGTLYRVSKLGGGQRKILDNVNTTVSFSPDGKLIAFVRVNNPNDPADLIIASADGDSERVLAKRTLTDSDFFFSDRRGPGPMWSPDGQMLACATHDKNLGSANIEILDVKTGAGRRLNLQPWQDISRVAWLADGSGLVLSAKDVNTSPWQLRLVSYPAGETRALTNDPNNYAAVAGASDSSSFVTVNAEEHSNIWLVETANGSQQQPRMLSERRTVSEVFWSANGQLTFVARDFKSSNLWTQEANGTPPRQLTFKSDNFNPVVTPDQQHVLFVSNREGGNCIWRMDADGRNPKRLTDGPADTMPSLTADGAWFVYRTSNGIRKMSIEGGPVIKLLDNEGFSPVISPDGQLLALFSSDRLDSKKWYLAIFDFRSMSPVARFDLPDATEPFAPLRWTPSGDALTFISSAGGAANIWLQPLRGGSPKPLTHFGDAEIYSFAWSPDGKQIACVRNVKVSVPMLVRLF